MNKTKFKHCKSCLWKDGSCPLIGCAFPLTGNKQKKFTYKKIPAHLITDEVKKLSIAWVEGLPTQYSTIMPDIAQKQKLASDIQNYAEQKAAPLLRVINDFINKVDTGKARSTDTYNKMKRALEIFKRY